MPRIKMPGISSKVTELWEVIGVYEVWIDMALKKS
jgi:hypothetical protein